MGINSESRWLHEASRLPYLPLIKPRSQSGDAVKAWQDMTDQFADSRDGVRKALEDSLRNLARNMAAISVGGGEPGELVDQIVRVAESLIAYNESFGTRPEEALIRRALARNSSAPDE